jgi:hypothetical protein
MDLKNLSHRELLEIIEKHKEIYINKFLLEHTKDDIKGYAVDLRCYDNYLEQFDHYKAIEEYEFETLEDLVKRAKKIQFERGGSWQVSFTDDEKDDYKWFEISETSFDWDF